MPGLDMSVTSSRTTKASGMETGLTLCEYLFPKPYLLQSDAKHLSEREG